MLIVFVTLFPIRPTTWSGSADNYKVLKRFSIDLKHKDTKKSPLSIKSGLFNINLKNFI